MQKNGKLNNVHSTQRKVIAKEGRTGGRKRWLFFSIPTAVRVQDGPGAPTVRVQPVVRPLGIPCAACVVSALDPEQRVDVETAQLGVLQAHKSGSPNHNPSPFSGTPRSCSGRGHLATTVKRRIFIAVPVASGTFVSKLIMRQVGNPLRHEVQGAR